MDREPAVLALLVLELLVREPAVRELVVRVSRPADCASVHEYWLARTSYLRPIDA